MTLFVKGTITARSPLLSPTWEFTEDDRVVARATRHVRRRCSTVRVPEAGEWQVVHDGWDTVEVLENEHLAGTAVRLNQAGTRWDITCDRFGSTLSSESQLHRRWALGPPGAPIATIQGGHWNFNRMQISLGAPTPLAAIILTWQIIVRAWEASSASVATR